MKAAEVIATMDEGARLDYVRAQVWTLEEDTARAHLAYQGFPSDDVAVRRLVFARELYMTLQLHEFA
jgi:hypothetical protein